LLAQVIGWAIIFSVFPRAAQDFPLGDDWVYAYGATHFAHGHIDYLHWAGMPQLGQWLWAYPFIAWFGAGLVGLRMSTILLGLFGMAAFYDLARQAGAEPKEAAVVTATLALNPFFVLLQGSFMTDIPALAFGLLSLAFYDRALAGKGSFFWIAGALFAILAGCTRQNMVAVAPAVGLLYWRCPPRQRLLAAFAIIVPILAGLGTHFWFEARPDVQHPLMVRPSLDRAFLIAFIILHAGGLAIAPLIALDPRPRSLWRFTIAALAMGASAFYWWRRSDQLVFGGWFPYATGLIGYSGPYAGLMAGNMEAWLPHWLRVALTVAGCLCGGWLIDRVLDGLRVSRPVLQVRGYANPVVLFALLQFPLLLITAGVNDRYMFMTLPGLLILATPLKSRLLESRLPAFGGVLSISVAGSPRPRDSVASSPRLQDSVAGSPRPREGERGGGEGAFQRAKTHNAFAPFAPAVVALAIMGLISFGLMHDCLAWNSARWALGKRAVARDIEPRRIEGGMEWNGWNSLHDPPPVFQQPPKKNLLLGFTRKYFPGVTGELALAFAPLPGLDVLDHEDYRTWLPPRRQTFYLIAPKQ
jgi:hypothetical protein